MKRSPETLREDLLAVWMAGVDGVRVDHLVRQVVSLEPDCLSIDDDRFSLDEIDRLIVLGGGKASGSMAETLESILEPLFDRKEILGLINIPEDCFQPLQKIRLHPARPMGANEPTEAAVAGVEEMLRLLDTATPDDLCLCLLSGGGSALLPAPVPEISLADKLELTRFLSGAGATIQELNTVRKQISRIKGGGLKKRCRGKRLVSLILSDVPGDPLDVIASGPTVDDTATALDALEILRRFASEAEVQEGALTRIAHYLNDKETGVPPSAPDGEPKFLKNVIIGNNAVAVEAAGMEALRRGYSFAIHSSRQSEGPAEEIGDRLVGLATDMLKSGPDCLIHGGEPVVRLVPPEKRGKGGRNQQLVLASVVWLLDRFSIEELAENPPGIALLSGGTDGEDGPTDAAGAWFTPAFWPVLRDRMKVDPDFDPKKFLERNDAYRFFEPLEALLKTGPTGTNVCDLRVVLVDRIADAAR